MAYIGNNLTIQQYVPTITYLSGDGVTTDFYLPYPVASAAQIIVTVENVIQNPSSAFTVLDSTLTFTSAPPSGSSNIWVEYTSLQTTANALPAYPSVTGDLVTSGGQYAKGAFSTAYTDGIVTDYTTGLGRISVGSSDGIAFYRGGVANTESMRIDTSGNVGIGTTSPNQALTIQKGASTDAAITLRAAGNTASAECWIGQGADSIVYLYNRANNSIVFGVNNVEQMRLDSSGNLKFNSGYGSVATAYGCRAWVNFNGTGTVAIRASGNVSSITDNGIGNYTVNLINAMPNTNYSVNCTRYYGVGDNGRYAFASSEQSSKTTTAFAVYILYPGVTFADSDCVDVSVFR